MVTPRLESAVPIRSTGASNALQQLGPVIKALAASAVVIDITVEGMLHAVELAEILCSGTRL
jgi:2,5-dihydroxypyridine 5,6-dioxygenase